MALSAHVDTFARDNLPPREQWPDLIHLDRLGYPEQMNCATELLDRAVAAGLGDKTFIYSPHGNWTYGDLLRKSNQVANALRAKFKMIPGERVLLHGPNTALFVAHWFGIVKAGGIVVATMPMLRAKEIAVIAEKARCRIGLSDSRVFAEMQQASAPFMTERASFFDGDFDATVETQGANFQNVATAGDDVVLIAFTSGTTGIPKGTMHFHRDVMAICDCFPPHVLKPSPDDVFIGSPPLAFTFGLGGLVLFPMRVGASTVMLEKAPPPELARACQQYGATVSFTSPTGYRFMLDNLKADDLCDLKKCVSAGETLPKATSDAWFERTGLRIIDGIGATEILHIFISSSGSEIRPGSTGKPVWGYEAKVIGDDGESLPAGEIGRLAVRGPTGCRYLADDRQRNYVIDGWNVTGDAYRMDEDGYFWFQARNDDIIVSGGYNISGPEVEEVLLCHPSVKECAVVASPDEMRGNIVKAFVVLREEQDAGERELQDFVKAQIAPYKYPRAVQFVESLPKTETGKLQRFKLREAEHAARVGVTAE